MSDPTLHPDCNGSVFCPVANHVQVTRITRTGKTISHVPLTRSQEKALRERREAAIARGATELAKAGELGADVANQISGEAVATFGLAASEVSR